MTILAAKVWHYWLMVPLFFASVLVCIALVIGYLAKVQAPQHPRRGQSVRR